MKALIAAAIVALSITPAAAAGGSGSIVDVASKAGVFGTLLAAATAAGFSDDLTEVKGLTVFAPTDKAFAALPPGTVANLLKPENKDKLRAIIAYHIVPAALTSHEIPRSARLIETLNGCERVKTKRVGFSVFVDGNKVVKADIRASNGVIHVIDKVLIPERACP